MMSLQPAILTCCVLQARKHTRVTQTVPTKLMYKKTSAVDVEVLSCCCALPAVPENSCAKQGIARAVKIRVMKKELQHTAHRRFGGHFQVQVLARTTCASQSSRLC